MADLPPDRTQPPIGIPTYGGREARSTIPQSPQPTDPLFNASFEVPIASHFALDESLRLARVLERIGAKLIDFALTTGVAFVVVLALQDTTTEEGLDTLIGFFSILATFDYFPIMEAHSGQTIGKKITKIQVVRDNGQSVSYGRAYLRALAGLVDMFFWGIIGIAVMSGSKRRKRIGDMAAGTIVIKA